MVLFLGGCFSNKKIKYYLDGIDAKYIQLDDSKLMPKLAELLDKGNIIGWFNGRMEFGPRALGGRSIIGDPRNPEMQMVMNLKIKYRESFRPFAPAIKAEQVSAWFDIDRKSPYMLLVAPVREEKHLSMSKENHKLNGINKLKIQHSQIPAVTHIDYSARIQTVHKNTNPRFYSLIEQFERRTNCPLLINTSFNVRSEPIVYTPADAYQCFMRTEMDYLVLENILLAKTDQPTQKQNNTWKKEFELD